MNRLFTRILTWFYNFLHVQLFLSLMSLPLLIAWGLPFSLMTVVGNLLFTPFLCAFLIVSTAIFFTELAHLPNQFLIDLLNLIWSVWHCILQKGSTHWLFAIDRTGLYLALASSIVACGILHHKKWGREKNSWKLLLPLLLLPFLYQTIKSFIPYHGSISCIRKEASIKSKKGRVSVIDYGALGEKKSAATWVQYTFLPETIRQCGSIKFATVECPYPNVRTLQALTALIQHAHVEKIRIIHPYRRSRFYKEQYQALKKTADNERVVIESMNWQPQKETGFFLPDQEPGSRTAADA